MMTSEEVAKLVAEVEEAVKDGDDEVAHSREDDLHKAVLIAISNGMCDDPAACAAAAVKTVEMCFARWCA